MNQDVLFVLVTVVITTFLLGMGATAGFFAGTRAFKHEPATTPGPRAANLVEPDDELLAGLDLCLSRSQSVARQSQQLASLMARHDLPPEAVAAIKSLQETTRGLEMHLDRTYLGALRGSPAQRPAVNIQDKLAESAAATLPRSGLTTTEISSLTGGPVADPAKDQDVANRRYPYECFQEITPWYPDDDAPALSRTASVRCHDLSVEGISFYWPEPPGFRKLVVSLGTQERSVLMVAEVCSCKPLYKHDEVEHLVGCRFLRRMDEAELGEDALLVAR